MYQVKVDEFVVTSVENTQPEEFTDMHVYVSSPWGHTAADGEVKNLKYEFYDGLPEGTLIGIA